MCSTKKSQLLKADKRKRKKIQIEKEIGTRAGRSNDR